ncbi:MAG TPA: ABC transporter permease [Candidatus Krumholzibacteria bacterium]
MHLFRMYWQRTLRRPGSVLLWLALPFVFMAIYTMAFGNDSSSPPKTTLAIVDQDSSLVSRLVKSALAQGPAAEMLTLVDAHLADVEVLFEKEKASAALVIPRKFGESLLNAEKPITLVLWTNPRHTIGPQIAESVTRSLAVIADGLLTQFAAPLRTISSLDRTPTTDEVADISRSFFSLSQNTSSLAAIRNIDVTIVEEAKDTEAQDFNLAAMFFPGLVMFGLLSVGLNLEHRFLRDRTNHVTRRFVTAPVSPWSVALQQRLYTASFVYVVGVASALLGGLIWRIPAHGLAAAHLIVIALALFVSGFNGIIFSLSSSVRAVSAISSITMVFLSILSGTFFPAELMPAGLKALTQVLPTGMANLGLTHSLTGKPLGISLPVLFAVCGAFFAGGLFMGRRRIL